MTCRKRRYDAGLVTTTLGNGCYHRHKIFKIHSKISHVMCGCLTNVLHERAVAAEVHVLVHGAAVASFRTEGHGCPLQHRVHTVN
jgi:hypothetical protein